MVTKRTIELSVGDYLVDEFGTEIEIFNIILEGEFVYDLGVEDNDLYIANGAQ
jgi:intein/homing endonuclease